MSILSAFSIKPIFKNKVIIVKKMQIQQNQKINLVKKILLPLLIFFAGCTNSPAPQETATKTDSHVKHKKIAARAMVNPWTVNTYATKSGESAKRKYVRFDTEGNFSNADIPNGYLYAVIYVDKVNAGIFLHESGKTSPAAKFSGPVTISMTNSAGDVLKMTSTRGWNKSMGILIERNNSDYSQFRIFLLQASGVINVEIQDNDSSVFHFDINADGFGKAFSQI